MSTDAYTVEGYGERTPSYDGPYLDGQRMDPNVQFAFAGDPEKQAQLQEIIDSTEGAPTLANGVVTIKTSPGEPNVVIHTANTDEVKTIVLDETRVDELSRKNEEALLQGSVPRYDADGNQVNEEEVDLSQDVTVNEDAQRNGADYGKERTQVEAEKGSPKATEVSEPAETTEPTDPNSAPASTPSGISLS